MLRLRLRSILAALQVVRCACRCVRLAACRNPSVPQKATNFVVSFAFPSASFVTASVRRDCRIRGNVSEPQERTMTVTLSRRNAFLFTALAAALPLVGVIARADAEEVPLAIKGYDPVAYFTDGKPVRGAAEFEFEWDDRRWRFASAEHRDLFKASPVRYAPQFGHYCAMALALNKVVVA